MSISSVNDWQKLGVPNAEEDAGDWLRYERPSSLQRVLAQERELESRRLAAYAEYVELVESDQRRVPPKFKVSPLSYEDWSKYIPADVTDISLASQIATNAALLKITRTEEAALAEAESKQAREDVLAGKPDKEFVLPDEIKGLRMSLAEAKAYASEQSKLFVEHNPEYYPCPANVAAITKYLTEQTDVVIPNEECFRLAWVRLRELGLIEQRPVPAPEPVQDQSSKAVPGETELVDGWDLQTGEPRKYSQAEIWKMSSRDVKKAFRMWTDREGDRRPRFTRGYFGR